MQVSWRGIIGISKSERLAEAASYHKPNIGDDAFVFVVCVYCLLFVFIGIKHQQTRSYLPQTAHWQSLCIAFVWYIYLRLYLCLYLYLYLLTTNCTLAIPLCLSAAIYRIVGLIAFMNFCTMIT